MFKDVTSYVLNANIGQQANAVISHTAAHHKTFKCTLMMTLLEQLCYAQNEAYKTPKSTMRQVGRRIKTAALIES